MPTIIANDESDNESGNNNGKEADVQEEVVEGHCSTPTLVGCIVKYATCTLLGGALTCWKSHVRTVGHDVTYEMSWKSLMKMMTEAYCPRNEIQKMLPEETDKVERQADNKRRMENNPRDDHVQQPSYKRQNVARAYTVGPGEKKEYAGTLPLCNKCNYHHTGLCTAIECPELRNQNRRNQAGSSEAYGRVYALGGGETNQDPNNVVDDIDA
ncbi:hypothetical protein Tco_0024671 [Tanacetum coccineum]